MEKLTSFSAQTTTEETKMAAPKSAAEVNQNYVIEFCPDSNEVISFPPPKQRSMYVHV